MGTSFVPFSLESEAFVQGGLLQDVDVEVIDLQWVPWDYNKPGTVDQDILALKCMLQVLGEDHKPVTGPDGAPQAPTEQFWSAGGVFADVVVSDNGYMVGGTDRKSALTKNSNAHVFLESLRAKGLPKGYLEDGNLAKLKGLRFHLVRTPAPKRDFAEQRGRAGREQGDTIPTCGYLVQGPQPWDKSGKTVKGGAATAAKVNGAVPATTTAASTAPAGVQADADTEAQAEKLIREVLGASPNQTVAKLAELKVQVFRAATKDKTIDAGKRNVIGKLAENGPWIEERAIASVSGDGSVTLI